MTVAIRIVYQGELRCHAQHVPSGTELHTDAPLDNQGRGESFSPTDLVATAFGSCMLTIMGIVAERHGIDLRGTTVQVEKHMVADPERRIGALSVTVQVPCEVAPADQARLEAAARGCPVHRSLSEVVARPLRFRWGSAS